MPQERYVGIDIHKKMAVWAIINREGQLLKQGETRMEDLKSLAEKQLSKDDLVVIEATGNSYYAYDQLAPYVKQVVVANALAMHDRSKGKRKTDKVDAFWLAKALAGNYVSEVWVPPVEVRDQRELNSHRHALGEQVITVKNQMRALLLRHGKEFRGKDLFSKQVLEFAGTCGLSENTRMVFESKWRLGNALAEEIGILDKNMAQAGLKDPNCLKLMTLPGIGSHAAAIIKGEIGDISRFDSPKKLSSYAGIVPSVYQSGETLRYGSITKQGRSLLRWILVEAAHAATLTKGPIQDRYYRLLRKGKTKGTAIIAIAHYLLELVWHLLSKNSPFRDAKPEYLIRKFRDMMKKAYGRCPKNGAPALANAVMGWSSTAVLHPMR